MQCAAAVIAGVVAAMVLTVIFPPKARAEEGGAVRLLAEPCRLTDQVTNLPRRATWTEGAKVYEGCWGPHPQAPGVVSTYWEDKTVVPILIENMTPIKEEPKVDA